MKRESLTAMLCLSLLLGGCGASAQYVPTSNVQPKSAHAFEDVLMTYTKPARPYINTGRIDCNAKDTAKSLFLMRRRAAEIGLDGIGELYCSMNGQEQAGSCAGNGFIWRSP